MAVPPSVPIFRQSDLARLGVAMYDVHVLTAIFHLLLGTFALWLVYLFKGREDTGRGGFVLWFPFLLVATVGTGILARHGVEESAVPLPAMVYFFPLAFLVAVVSRPIFKMNVSYLTVHAATAVGIVIVVAWLLRLAVEPVLQRY